MLTRKPRFAMHPVLVVVPWPELGVPFWPFLALLAAAGVVVGVVAYRRENRLVASLGAVLASAALVTAFTSRALRLVVGSFDVRAWGVSFAAALVAGSVLALRSARRRGLDAELVARACIGASLGGILGGRMGWVLLHPLATGSVEGAAAFYRGGLSVWGGLAGALVGMKLASRAGSVSFRELADLGAPSFALGLALTRIGCFLEGCDFGVPLSEQAPSILVALGTFPAQSPAWTEHVLSRGLPPSASASYAVHPVALYEACGGFLLAASALLLARRGLRPGYVFATTASMYLLLRVALDGLRDDRMDMWVSRALLLSLALIGAAAWGIRSVRGHTSS